MNAEPKMEDVRRKDAFENLYDWSKTRLDEGVTRLFRENLLLIIIKVLPAKISSSNNRVFF